MPTVDHSDSIFAEHVRLLYRQLPLAIAVNLLNVAIATALLFGAFGTQILGWTALGAAAGLFQGWTWWQHGHSRNPAFGTSHWSHQALLGAGLAGSTWGVGALSMLSSAVPAAIVLPMAVIGTCTGAAGMFTTRREPILAFAVPAALPLVVVLSWLGSLVDIALIPALIGFVLLLSSISHNIRRSIEDGMRYRLELQRANIEAEQRTRGLQEAARDLAVSRDSAEAANRMKSEFLANMSHELRTPLNAIIGFSELMSGELFGPLGAAVYKGYSTDILASGRHLLQIINDILDISKIEAGTMQLNVEDVSIEELVATCRRAVMPRAAKSGLSLDTEVPEGMQIVADATFLKRMLLNLLTNAVKFTPSGGQVTVKARTLPASDAGPAAIELMVQDTGIGMSPAEIEIAMLPFRQVDGSLSRRHEGTGLGLPLAKSLAEMHGGKLSLVSEQGSGTKVLVHLPVKPPGNWYINLASHDDVAARV